MVSVHVFPCSHGMFPALEFGGIRVLLEFFQEVGGFQSGSSPVLAVRSFEPRFSCGMFFTPLPAFDDYLRAISVGHVDCAPESAGIWVLRPGRDGLDCNGACVVLAQSVLNGIDMMLTHVSETAFIIVPIASEAAMDTMGMVRLDRRRPKPHVIVQHFWHWLRHQIMPSAPLTNLESGRAVVGVKSYGQRSAQQSAHHNFAHEPARTTPPGIRLVHDSVAFDRLDQRLAFRQGMGGWLLGLDIKSRLCRSNGDLRVPMWRCRNMDRIDSRLFQDFAPI